MTIWKEFKLGEVVEVAQGLAINVKTKHLLQDHGLPLLRITDLIHNTKSQFVNASLVPKQCIASYDEIIYTRTGQVGLVFKGKYGVIHNNCFKVIPNKNLLNANFLYWYLTKSDIRELANSIASGSVQKDLTHSAFKSIPIKLPDLPTQKAIAEILSSLDDKIELNNQINKELEELAQALFKQWFIDFEFPNENGQPYKSSGGEMIESELGEIPKGWEVKLFKNTVEKYIDNRGKTPPTISDGIPLVEVKHMSDNSIFPSFKTQKFVSSEVYNDWFRAHLEPDDILMSTVGTIGRLNITPKDKIFAIAQNVLGVRFNKDILNQLYMFCMMRSKMFNDEINSRLIITVQASIKRSDIEKIPILIPAKSLLHKFKDSIESLFELISTNTDEIDRLTELRDTLLPKLISGELEVSEALTELKV